MEALLAPLGPFDQKILNLPTWLWALNLLILSALGHFPLVVAHIPPLARPVGPRPSSVGNGPYTFLLGPRPSFIIIGRGPSATCAEISPFTGPGLSSLGSGAFFSQGGLRMSSINPRPYLP